MQVDSSHSALLLGRITKDDCCATMAVPGQQLKAASSIAPWSITNIGMSLESGK